jgi:hypothetical protein
VNVLKVKWRELTQLNSAKRYVRSSYEDMYDFNKLLADHGGDFRPDGANGTRLLGGPHIDDGRGR